MEFRKHNFWTINKNLNQQLYLKELSEKYNFNTYEDWYKLKQDQFKETRGNGLLCGIYKGSPCLFLKSLIPEYKWLPWLFKQTPKHFWSNKDNVKEYCEWLYNKLEYKSMDDWYSVKQEDFRNNSGMGLQMKYKCILINLLKDAYPDYEWLPWKFDITNKFWGDIKNQRKFIKYIEKEEGISSPKDWYNYGGKTIIKYGGESLLSNQYKCCFTNLIIAVYPEYNFKIYMFIASPKKYWWHKTNIQSYLKDLFIHMNFTSIEDWYRITSNNIITFHGGGLLDKYAGSYIKLITENIEYKWQTNKFLKAGFSMIAIEWLQYCEVRDNTKIHHKLNSPDGKEYRVKGTKYFLDGYGENKCGYDFLGDYYHGNANRYKSDIFNKRLKKTMGEIYKNTYARINRIRSLGQELNIMWEGDWLKGRKAVIKLQRLFRKKKI
jgi:hypothetical protein